MKDADLLFEKQKIIKERLAKAAAQVEVIEHQASLGRSIDSHVFRRASAEFNNLIPKGKEVFGCKSTCPLFCKCSSHLFQRERAEKHDLYMRYFDAKEAAEKFISEVEQASFALPGVKRGYEVARKQTQVKRQLHPEEVQLEFQL